MALNSDVHPAAAVWPMLPEPELRALTASIEAHGQRLPIIRWRGQIIDGRNRLAACRAAGIDPVIEDRDAAFSDDAAVWNYCFDMNHYRRHLSRKQTRQVIVARLKVTPRMSNRQIAAEVKADHKTVASERQRLEATGEIPRLIETTGRDGKQRTARRAKTPHFNVAIQTVKSQLLKVSSKIRTCRW